MREKKLHVTRFVVGGPVDLTIAVVADLHGRDPAQCLAALAAEKPGLICVAGDALETMQPPGAPCDNGEKARERARWLHRFLHLIDGLVYRHAGQQTEENWANAMRFFRVAKQIAPVVYATGNHDYWLAPEEMRRIRDAGVTLLSNSSVSMRFGGEMVEIGGLTSRDGLYWLTDFARKPGYRVLICHRPEYFAPHIRVHDIPLVLSGHAHGGQWRVFGRGLFSPGQGLLPQYTRGIYEGRLVVSAGLSNTANLPRINNPVELVIVKVRRETAE